MRDPDHDRWFEFVPAHGAEEPTGFLYAGGPETFVIDEDIDCGSPAEADEESINGGAVSW